MAYSTSVKDIIRKRTSWRTYIHEKVDEDLIETIKKFVKNNQTSPFGGDARFIFHQLPDSSKINSFASYGLIKGAKTYLFGIVKRNSYDFEHFAYVFEKIILKCTELQLRTCWVGAARRDLVEKIINLKKNDRIPAVSPLGYGTSRNLSRTIVRWVLKAKSRLPFNELFFTIKNSQLVPLSQDNHKFIEVLEMVRLAPSAKNKQPWRIVKEQNQEIFHFFRNNPLQYARLDIGIAVCHFDLTCKEENIPGEWYFQEESELKSLIPNNWLYTISWKSTKN